MDNIQPQDSASDLSNSTLLNVERRLATRRESDETVDAAAAVEETAAVETESSTPMDEETLTTEKAVSPSTKEEEEDEDEVKKEDTKEEEPAAKKKTIADFGYHFKDGQLRTIEGDAGFTFTTQKEYEALGDAIGDAVYEMMEMEGLQRVYINEGRTRRFYFASPDYEKKERILVLIHGMGVVKAGQWARKLIINESLTRGTQLDYIKRGLANGWGVVVLNYNEKCEGAGNMCHNMSDHGVAEWTHAFDGVGDSDILVVAHSYGGSIASEVVRRMHRDEDYRVILVCLTDSWFSQPERDVFAVNWTTQKKKLQFSNGICQMYSGDDTHEGTSSACFNSCFALLERMRRDTEEEEFAAMLKDSETIMFDDFKERLRKKIEENKALAVQKEQEPEEAKGEMKVNEEVDAEKLNYGDEENDDNENI